MRKYRPCMFLFSLFGLELHRFHKSSSRIRLRVTVVEKNSYKSSQSVVLSFTCDEQWQRMLHPAFEFSAGF